MSVRAAYHGVAKEEGQVGENVLAGGGDGAGSRQLRGASLGSSLGHGVCRSLVVEAVCGLVCWEAGVECLAMRRRGSRYTIRCSRGPYLRRDTERACAAATRY